MPTELEAKLRVTDHDAPRRKLRELGAKSAGAHLETNNIFDAPNKSLFAAHKALRLRINRDIATGHEHAILTYKGPRTAGHFKSREEIETGVEDPKAMLDILKALNFVQVLSFQKKRESWELGGCKIELDELPQLGLFLEIEGPDDAAIKAVQEKLGLADAAPIKESYVGMLMEWLKTHPTPNNIITF